MRAYTPSSLIDQVGYFDLIIKAYEFGKMSTYLHSLNIGQEVDVRGPVGRFKYSKNSHKKMGLIAGGTGLTPCLQVIRTILECKEYQDDHTNFVLFFQNRTIDDILLHDELNALAKKFSNRLEIHYFLSNISKEDEDSYGKLSNEHIGYISSSMIRGHMSPDECSFVGLCGPSGFNKFVKDKLLEVGHKEGSVFVW
jgi:cytochrome-b5 reductase